ncbi:RNA polymerase sigma factor [Chitinophaga defluvii]|uniref:RNA polymerase sigma-70 factor n=1 Tax=Chitinophaga defluvii TaxID=3163343 RepID=A0ABV2T413_9BACT
MNALKDNELLLAFHGGDEKAFNQLFARYRNQLFTYLFKITKSRETAEEIVLDVFLKIWSGREMAPQITNFEAFLFRVAHNKAYDFLRAAQRSILLKRDISEAILLSSDETADEKLLNRDVNQTLKTAVDQLSPQRQLVFELSREQGLNYDEIAARLQLSRNTVRNHLSASLQFIRTYLAQGLEIVILLLSIAR